MLLTADKLYFCKRFFDYLWTKSFGRLGAIVDYYLQTPEHLWDLNCARPQINLLHLFYPLAIIAFSPS